MVNFTNIPAELKNSCRFTAWKKEKDKEGRLTKIPYNPATGQRAQSNNPATFSEFPQAAAAYAIGGYEGIGIRVSDGIGAFDIDHCIKDDGTLSEERKRQISLDTSKRRWLNDGVCEKFVYSDEMTAFLNAGWRTGRLSHQ